MNTIEVRTGTLKTALAPAVLESIGIGSCVVVVLHDPLKKVAGMVHAMLPHCKKVDDPHPLRYTDTAIETLYSQIQQLGARPQHLEAYVVGGAQMFASLQNTQKSVGVRNVAAAKEKLEQLAIPIQREETGGNHGRHVRFSVQNGEIEL